MQRREQIPEPWRSFLGELDREAAEETRLDCMGGFVVTQLYGFARETADLDVLQIAPFQVAVRKAIEEHAREGLPMYIGRDGKVVAVPAEELLEKS